MSALSKRFGPTVALDGASFDAGGDWSCLGVVGRNAAGKTTLLRILVGLLQADGGRVHFSFSGRDRPYADPREAFFIGETSLLPESFTGREYLDYLAALEQGLGVTTDTDLRDRLAEDLLLGAQLGKRIRAMSKGTKRKLEVVGALSSRVPLVVADELSEGLDIPSMREIERVLRHAGRNGQRFLVSSHDVAFLTAVADQVVVIDSGRVADLFRIDELGIDGAQERILAAFGDSGDEP